MARALLTHGAATAAELAEALDLTPAGVRRQLAILIEAGLVVAHDRAPFGPTPKRGRGRPGSVFSLTDRGRGACDSAYDDLALAALRFLQRSYGDGAVEEFARERAHALSGSIPLARAASPEELATTLTEAGYAAELQPLGEVAIQLCQHNCPVVDAAREFPVLCDAETEELSRLLDRHVTRLATLAHGDEVCTTVIPLAGGGSPADRTSTSKVRTRRKVSA